MNDSAFLEYFVYALGVAFSVLWFLIWRNTTRIEKFEDCINKEVRAHHADIVGKVTDIRIRQESLITEREVNQMLTKAIGDINAELRLARKDFNDRSDDILKLLANEKR